MAEIALARVDDRLVHGQVVTKWRKVYTISKIIIVDNDLMNNTFLANIYVAAAPTDVKVKIYDEDKAVRIWEKNQFGEGKVMLVFKTIQACERVLRRGVKLPFVNIGGLPKKPDKKMIVPGISFDEKDMESATQIHDMGIPVFIQMLPDYRKVDYDEFAQNYKKM